MKTCKKGLHQYEGPQCPVCHAERRNKWYQANKENAKRSNKQWIENNKERRSEYSRARYQNNKPKMVKAAVEYRKQRMTTDPLYRFSLGVRSLIAAAIKLRGFAKTTKTANILGCEFEVFQLHLINSAFNNYGSFIDLPGVYHMDHIIPMASAVTEEDVIRLNHYSNFQLLYADENRSLGAKGFAKTIRQGT